MRTAVVRDNDPRSDILRVNRVRTYLSSCNEHRVCWFITLQSGDISDS
ncbi:hypothetical protein GBAR_LOCUS10033 [Geodia barretti]|uniref:Uncharacterized protein n=1 Tax=Geodia barretti TaxID=519541 RepID=A0AA35RS84_GEOBA|nr:hypothetical protein GBAR_LOCUS10033 [Geodia barretti]